MSFALYLITDGANDRVVERTAAALSAAPGQVAVQARAKGASARELAELASALLPICRAARAPLLVNDRVDVAQLVQADGVHLPEAGVSVVQARALLGSSALVARSCHDRAGLEAAERAGADFATLGPVFDVPGKSAPLGVGGFGATVRGLTIPVYALGGVDASSALALREAGATGVAVIRAIYCSDDPALAAAGLIESKP